MARLSSEFRVYAVRNRLKAELQTLLATNRIGVVQSKGVFEKIGHVHRGRMVDGAGRVP